MSDSQSVIVVFNDDVTQEQLDKFANEVTSGGGEVRQRLDPLINGFAATLKPGQLQNFQANGVIKYIEPDQEVRIQ